MTVAGWVRTRRDSKGGFSFIELNDGSNLSGLQIVAERDLPNYQEDVLKLQTGCSIVAEGIVAASPGKGQKVELKAHAIQVVGWADPELYPLQKKRHSFEFLRTIAHLRPRTNTFGRLPGFEMRRLSGHPSIFSGKGVFICAYAHPDRKRL